MKRISVILLVLIIICLTGCNSKIPDLEEYKVVSVYQHMFIKTNSFGGVVSQELGYCFTYMGSDNQLHQVDKFVHSEYGLHKVCIGEENKYIVDGSHQCLYLTEETLKSIPIK